MIPSISLSWIVGDDALTSRPTITWSVFNNSGKKYPLDLFLKALKNYAAGKLKVDSKNNILAMYQEISDTQYKLSLPNVSKKYIFEAMLLNLWKIGRM